MSNTTKNQITFDGGAVIFTRPDGGVYTVPASAVYVVYHDDTATFKLVALPRESGLAIMSVRASNVEVDGQSYSDIEELKTALNDKFAKAGGVSFEVVEELPESGETNIIYLVPSPDTQGTYDEYIWLEEEERWELLGSTQIDLSGYVTDEEFSAHTANTSIHVTTALTTEIQTISGKVDTNEQITAAALNELNSRFGIFAAELDDKQDVLTAGEGISISGNVISVSGQEIVIDSTLSSGSSNAVANSAITAALDLKCNIGNGADSPIISRNRNDGNYWLITKANGGTYLDSGWININGQPVITNGANEYFSGNITNLLLATKDEFSGHTADTSIHVTTAQTTAWSAKQDALVAGEGISISGNVISVSGGNESDVYWVNGDKWLTQGVDDTDWDNLVAALGAHKAIYATIQSRYFVCESMALNGNDLTFTTSMDDRFLWYTVTKNGSNDYSLTYGANTLGSKQDVLTAGEGISISGNVISVSGGNESDVYLFADFWDLYNGDTEMTDELWDEIASAFTANKVFINDVMYGNNYNKTPLIVDFADDGHSEGHFSASLNDNYGYYTVYINKSYDEFGDAGYYVEPNYYTSYPQSVVFDEYYNGVTEMDAETWDNFIKACNNGSIFIDNETDENGVMRNSVLSNSLTEDAQHLTFTKFSETGWQKIDIEKVEEEGVDPEFIITPSSGSTGGASQAALDELSGQVQTIDAVVATALNALNEEVSGATGAVSTLSGTVTGLSQSVNSLSNRVSNVEQNKPDVYLIPFKDIFDGGYEVDIALWEDIINAYDNHSVIMAEPMAGVDTEYQIISVDHPTTTQLILRLASDDEIVIDWNEGEDPEFEVTTAKGARIRQISQADYNALVTKDPNTLYIINDNV